VALRGHVQPYRREPSRDRTGGSRPIGASRPIRGDPVRRMDPTKAGRHNPKARQARACREFLRHFHIPLLRQSLGGRHREPLLGRCHVALRLCTRRTHDGSARETAPLADEEWKTRKDAKTPTGS
jgi:hypothetical protein